MQQCPSSPSPFGTQEKNRDGCDSTWDTLRYQRANRLTKCLTIGSDRSPSLLDFPDSARYLVRQLGEQKEQLIQGFRLRGFYSPTSWSKCEVFVGTGAHR